MPHTAYVSLGSNLGDRRAHLNQALQSLNSHPNLKLARISRIYETPAIGGPENQNAFLNAAVELQTMLAPVDLLAVLQAIEHQAGRQRIVRWDARTLDLDLLLYDDIILVLPDLVIPHPRLALRRFILVPLAEIAPNIIEPNTGLSIQHLLRNLDVRPSVFLFDRYETPDPEALYRELVIQTGALDLRPDPSLTNRDPFQLDPTSPNRWLARNGTYEYEILIGRTPTYYNPDSPPHPRTERIPRDPTFALQNFLIEGPRAPSDPPHTLPTFPYPTFVITNVGSRHSKPVKPRPPRLWFPPNSPELVVTETVAACLAAHASCEPGADPPCPDTVHAL